MKLVFFGSSEFSVYVLDELKLHDILPNLIITTPDKPKGRKLTLTPTVVKIWAQKNNIPVIDPQTLKDGTVRAILAKQDWDLFLVASYGKIIPKEIFEIPTHQTLNIHPSLLPKYRGASPLQSQILENDQTIGVTIMQIEETMDTGPIVIQKTSPNPLLVQEGERASLGISSLDQGEGGRRPGGVMGQKELEKILAIEGARLFVHILPEWLMGAIDPIIQNEKEATYCQKIKKEDGELQIDLNDLTKNALTNILKIKAFEGWPTAYFFHRNKRVIITDAIIESSPTNSEQIRLKILKVIPEGKKEMPFADFWRGQK